MLRDLNAIAPLVTMFFLVTYAMLNGILLVEQRLQLLSFRPAMRSRPVVPLVGAARVAAGDVRHRAGARALAVAADHGGVLRAADAAPARRAVLRRAQRAVRLGRGVGDSARVARLPGTQERAWKPSLFVPVTDDEEARGSYSVLSSLAAPHGTVRLMGVTDDEDAEASRGPAAPAAARAHRGRVPVQRHARERHDRAGARHLLRRRADRGDAGPARHVLPSRTPSSSGSPTRPAGDVGDADLARVVAEAERQQVGTLLWRPHPVTALGQRRRVNVWIRRAWAGLVDQLGHRQPRPLAAHRPAAATQTGTPRSGS